jgi:hypothetical protein
VHIPLSKPSSACFLLVLLNNSSSHVPAAVFI